MARYLGGPIPADPSVAAATNSVGESADLNELRRRLEALEQAVFPPVAGTSDEGTETDPGEALPES